jgi:hypothetical protein
MALRRSKLQISIWVTWLLLWHSTGSHGQVCLQVGGNNSCQTAGPATPSLNPLVGVEMLWVTMGYPMCVQVNGQQQQPNPSSVQPAAGQDCCASQAHPAKQTACQGQAAAASNSRLQPEVPNILLQDYVYKGDFGEFRETFTFLQQKENHPSMIGALQATDEKVGERWRPVTPSPNTRRSWGHR